MKKTSQKDGEHSFEPPLITHTHNSPTRKPIAQFLESLNCY